MAAGASPAKSTPSRSYASPDVSKGRTKGAAPSPATGNSQKGASNGHGAAPSWFDAARHKSSASSVGSSHIPSSVPPPPAGVIVSADDALARKWRSGFIFFCRHDSFRETFERGVFGLPRHKLDLISTGVEPGSTALFLFDQTYRYLLGVYDATCAPGVDLDPNYLQATRASGPNAQGSTREGGSPFPAQVRFQRLHDFKPLEESKFCHLVSYNQGTNIFRHRLGGGETNDLLQLLANPHLAPVDQPLPYESNGYKRINENPRFREQRRAVYGESDA